MDLLKKRAAVVAEHAAMEKYDPAWKGTGLSTRPVAFVCDDEVYVVGECVAKVHRGLREFADRFGPAYDDEKRRPGWKYQLIAMDKCRKFLAEHPDPPEAIRVPQYVWNSYLFALGEVGVQVVTTDGTNC